MRPLAAESDPTKLVRDSAAHGEMVAAAPRRDVAEVATHFGVSVVRLAHDMEKQEYVPRALARQLLQAGTSVGANVREGLGGQSVADFISKYAIALKEAHKTAHWLEMLAATGVVQPERLTPIQGECGELIELLTTLLEIARQNSKSATRRAKTK